jgi:hypothetical protein
MITDILKSRINPTSGKVQIQTGNKAGIEVLRTFMIRAGGIPTHDLCRRAAAGLRLRQRGHGNRPSTQMDHIKTVTKRAS